MKKLFKTIAVLLCMLTVMNIMTPGIYAAAADTADTAPSTAGEEVNLVYGYHSVTAGRAGTVKVNDFTLKPSAEFGLLSIDGNLAPVSLGMRYNSKAYDYLSSNFSYDADSFGAKVLTSYSAFIKKTVLNDEDRLVFLSSNDNIIFFKQQEQNEDFTNWICTDDSYSEWSITEYTYEASVRDDISVNGVNVCYSLYNNRENIGYAFDRYGRLTAFIPSFSPEDYGSDDSMPPVIYIEYTDPAGADYEKISKITDGVGNEYRFIYTDSLLTKVKCYSSDGEAIIAGSGENSAPLEASLGYMNGCLSSVTFPDGNSTFYSYNESGLLTGAVNIDSYKIELEYSNDRVSRVCEYALGDDVEYIEGNYFTIVCSGNYRTFTDNNGNVITKRFDSLGNIIYIKDKDGNYIYGAGNAEPESSTCEETTEPASEPVTTPDTDPTEENTEEPESVSFTVCPCRECTQMFCECVCADEESCTCIQCKRRESSTEDEFGNVLSDSRFDGVKTMTSSNTYTPDGNHIASSTDEAGNTVYYVYDNETGFLDRISGGDTVVDMEYDSVGNLTRFAQQVGGLSNGTEMSNSYTYENDRITSIEHNGFSYNFTYDEWGNRTSIKINETEIVTSSYDENSRLTSISYANGQSVSYIYNDDGNICGISLDGGETLAYEYTYSEDAVITSCIDRISGFVTTYDDSKTEIRDLNTNDLIYSSVSNADGNVEQTVYNKTIVYEYDSDSNQTTGKTTSSVSFNDTFTTKKNDETVTAQLDYINTVTKDWFDRTESKSFTSALTLSDGTSSMVNGQYGYTYDDTADTASPRILSHSSSFTNGSTDISRTDCYEYDNRGNITGIFRLVNGERICYYSYEYDEANQLTRENNLDYDRTIVYVYDKGGNITQKTSYAYTLGDITPETEIKNKAVYVYSDPVWKDKLTSFEYTDYEDSDNSFSSAVEYDNAGNITYFNGSHYTWTAGRQLKSVTDSDGIRIDYTYNDNGFMTTQTEYKNGEYESTTSYIWDSDTLIERRFYNKNDPESFTSSRIVYDSDGEPQALIVTSGKNGMLENEVGELILYYRRNLQGDITGLVDAEGSPMGEFVYDAYGNFTFKPESDGLTGVLDCVISFAFTPISYRGYVYTSLDSKHCYYYLGSRFYSPLLSRFMNADSIPDTGTGVVGTNMFAYCNNSPIVLVDPDGKMPLDIILTSIRVVFKALNILLKRGNKIVMMVYSDFTEQADWMQNRRYKYSDVIQIQIKTKDDFVKAWNNISEPIAELYLYFHGVASKLRFSPIQGQNENSKMMDSYEISRSLHNIQVLSYINLLSCNGATRNEDNYPSVAEVLATKCEGIPVRAVEDGYVTYRAWFQPFARYPLTKNGKWVEFVYKNSSYSKTTFNNSKCMPFLL